MAGHHSSVAAAGKSSRRSFKAAIKMVAPVNTSYCLLDETEILIQRLKPSDDRMYAIHNARGNLAFDVTRGTDPTTSSAVLRDASGANVLVMRKEHSDVRTTTWAAYRSKGDDNYGNLLFMIRKVKKLSPSFEIELPGYTNEHDSGGPQFTGRTKRFFQGELSVLRDRHETPIAKAKKIFSRSEYHSIQREKSQSSVTIHPGIDRAFVASICVILDLVYHNWSNNSKISKVVPSRIPRTLSENADGWTAHLARHHKDELESVLHADDSLDACARNAISEKHSSSLAIIPTCTLSCTLTCTLSLGSYFRSYMTLAGLLVSFFLAVF